METVVDLSCDPLKFILAVEVRMPSVKCLPDKSDFEINENETILEAALRANIPLAHACGGVAKCSTCRVSGLD